MGELIGCKWKCPNETHGLNHGRLSLVFHSCASITTSIQHDSGAGSGLSPNGQTCLHALGFPQAQIMAITTPIQEHILVEGDQVLARSDYPRRLYAKYGIPLTGTLRGDLVDMLAGPLRDAKSLRLGQAVTGVRELSETRYVVMRGWNLSWAGCD